MMTRHRADSLASIALALVLAGCTGWHQVEVSPTVLDQKHDEIRLTLPDGQRAVLKHPQLVRDSIVGTIQGHDTTVALGDVQRMALRRPDHDEAAAAGTLWVSALLTAAAAWAVLLISSGS